MQSLSLRVPSRYAAQLTLKDAQLVVAFLDKATEKDNQKQIEFSTGDGRVYNVTLFTQTHEFSVDYDQTESEFNEEFVRILSQPCKIPKR